MGEFVGVSADLNCGWEWGWGACGAYVGCRTRWLHRPLVSSSIHPSQPRPTHARTHAHALDAEGPDDLHGGLPLLRGEERLHLHPDLDDLHRIRRDHLVWVGGLGSGVKIEID